MAARFEPADGRPARTLRKGQGVPPGEPSGRTGLRAGGPYHEPVARCIRGEDVVLKLLSTTPPPRTASDQRFHQYPQRPIRAVRSRSKARKRACRSTRRPRLRPPFGRARAGLRVHIVARRSRRRSYNRHDRHDHLRTRPITQSPSAFAVTPAHPSHRRGVFISGKR